MSVEKKVIKRTEPSEADKRAASIIRAAWEKMKKDNPDQKLTQSWLGEKIGMTQGGVGHYLNGNRIFGLDALLAFCRVLKLSPMEVYPEIASGIDTADAMTVEYIELYKKAPKEIREAVLVLLRRSE
ncbi:helix-turn-helix domain-containing protein [Thiolinea disciformis]|uniref:helix-turn-helix domain-containing protein n=1 Tax=Thiolinea disciformis TaxID=125614 RepID=UPI000367539C|nr:helix-turn-helix transcriptional regulator [Thiolinea disciformis]